MTYLRRFWAPALGISAIVAVVLVTQIGPPSFGWFAYSPLSNASPWPYFVTPSLTVGISIAIAGMALLAGWVDFLIGRRVPAR